MIQRFLAVFTSFLFTCSLYADPFLMRISADSDPHSSVAGCINVFSGEFFWTENDIESKRAGGLNYSRVYDSGCLRPNVMGYGWGNNFAKDLIHFESNSKTTGSVLLGSCEYDPFPFAVQEQQKGSFAGKVHEGIFSLGYTISPEALAMGVPSFSRTKVFSENSKKWWKTKLPDGTLRTYERIEDEQKLKTGSLYRYRLAEEKLPNEHIRHYTYFPDSASLTKISVTNKDGSRELDSLSFTYGNKKNGYEREICSASGVKVYYKGVLSFVGYPLCPALVFDLNKTSGAHIEGSSYRTSYFHGPLGDDLKIDQIIRADSTIHVDYYDDIKKDSYGKAKALKVSWGGALNSIYTFKYLKKSNGSPRLF